MNDRQENKYSMYLAVTGVCENNSAVWSGSTPFTNTFNAFKQNTDAIRQERQTQEQSNTGLATDKQAAKVLMAEQAVTVSGIVMVFADIEGDTALKNAVDYSKTDILKARDTIARDRAALIKNKAEANLADLEEYGVTETMVTELADAISSFEGLISSPREAIAESAKATSNIDALMTECDKLLNDRLDKLLGLYKASQPGFYEAYFNARVIVDN